MGARRLLAGLAGLAALAAFAATPAPAADGSAPASPATVRFADWALLLAGDGVPLPLPGVIVGVHCGDPLVPLGRHHRLDRECDPPELTPLRPGDSLAGVMLVPEAAAAVAVLIDDARAAGVHPLVVSGFRSFAAQEPVFAYWAGILGPDEAARVSARPGHSEHQLGTTVDFSSAAVGFSLGPEFAVTAEGEWLRENAHRFGFAMSYPEGSEATTGYAYEPWHFRFIGEAAAEELRNSGLTLLEYLVARRP